MKKFKRAVSFIIMFMMIFSSLPALILPVSADEDEYTYEQGANVWNVNFNVSSGEYYTKLPITPEHLSYNYLNNANDLNRAKNPNLFDVEVKYDASNIHLLITVDATYSVNNYTQESGNTGDMWNQSCIQIGLASAWDFGDNRLEFGLARNSTTNSPLHTVWAQNPSRLYEFDPSGRYTVTENGNQLIYAVTVPFNTFLNRNTLPDGSIIGLSVVISQYNGYSYTHTQLAQGITEGKNAHRFAKLTLGTAPPPNYDGADTSWYYNNQQETNFTIFTAQQLLGLSHLVTAGVDNFADKIITLNNGIDLSIYPNWTPIGNTGNPMYSFQGTFDGAGNTISGLTIYAPLESYVGLFGYIAEGEVKNLNVNIANIVGGNYDVGVIAGSNHGTITNCTVSGSVSGTQYNVGGIAGENTGAIINCTFSGSVNAPQYNVGGIAGFNSGTITNCIVSSGSVNGWYIVGGIAGSNHISSFYSGTIKECTNNANVVGDHWVGGIVGYNGYDVETETKAEIIDCFNYGTVLGNRDTGDIVGFQEGPEVTAPFEVHFQGTERWRFDDYEELMNFVNAESPNHGDGRAWIYINDFQGAARIDMNELGSYFWRDNLHINFVNCELDFTKIDGNTIGHTNSNWYWTNLSFNNCTVNIGENPDYDAPTDLNFYENFSNTKVTWQYFHNSDFNWDPTGARWLYSNMSGTGSYHVGIENEDITYVFPTLHEAVSYIVQSNIPINQRIWLSADGNYGNLTVAMRDFNVNNGATLFPRGNIHVTFTRYTIDLEGIGIINAVSYPDYGSMISFRDCYTADHNVNFSNSNFYDRYVHDSWKQGGEEGNQWLPHAYPHMFTHGEFLWRYEDSNPSEGWWEYMEFKHFDTDGHPPIALKPAPVIDGSTVTYELNNQEHFNSLRLRKPALGNGEYADSFKVEVSQNGTDWYSALSTEFKDYVANGNNVSTGTSLIFATDFDGGPGAYHKIPVNPDQEGSKDVRPEESVNTEYNDSRFGSNIGWIQEGEWVQYTINVAQSGYYNFEAVLSSYDESSIQLYYNDDLIGNAISNTGGWHNYIPVYVGGVYMTAGTNVIKALFPEGGSNFAGIFIIGSDGRSHVVTENKYVPIFELKMDWNYIYRDNPGSHHDAKFVRITLLSGQSANGYGLELINKNYWYDSDIHYQINGRRYQNNFFTQEALFANISTMPENIWLGANINDRLIDLTNGNFVLPRGNMHLHLYWSEIRYDISPTAGNIIGKDSVYGPTLIEFNYNYMSLQNNWAGNRLDEIVGYNFYNSYGTDLVHAHEIFTWKDGKWLLMPTHFTVSFEGGQGYREYHANDIYVVYDYINWYIEHNNLPGNTRVWIDVRDGYVNMKELGFFLRRNDTNIRFSNCILDFSGIDNLNGWHQSSLSFNNCQIIPKGNDMNAFANINVLERHRDEQGERRRLHWGQLNNIHFNWHNEEDAWVRFEPTHDNDEVLYLDYVVNTTVGTPRQNNELVYEITGQGDKHDLHFNALQITKQLQLNGVYADRFKIEVSNTGNDWYTILDHEWNEQSQQHVLRYEVTDDKYVPIHELMVNWGAAEEDYKSKNPNYNQSEACDAVGHNQDNDGCNGYWHGRARYIKLTILDDEQTANGYTMDFMWRNYHYDYNVNYVSGHYIITSIDKSSMFTFGGTTYWNAIVRDIIDWSKEYDVAVPTYANNIEVGSWVMITGIVAKNPSGDDRPVIGTTINHRIHKQFFTQNAAFRHLENIPVEYRADLNIQDRRIGKDGNFVLPRGNIHVNFHFSFIHLSDNRIIGTPGSNIALHDCGYDFGPNGNPHDAPGNNFYRKGGGKSEPWASFLSDDGHWHTGFYWDESRNSWILGWNENNTGYSSFKDAILGKFLLKNPQPVDGGMGFADNIESYEKLFDGDLETKYADNVDEQNPYWAIWQYDRAYVADRFIWITANDSGAHPRRMGDGWTFSGSNDGEHWQVLYTGRADDYADVNYGAFWIDLPDNDTPYQYYRLYADSSHEKENDDSGVIQLSMVAVTGKPIPNTLEEALNGRILLPNPQPVDGGSSDFLPEEGYEKLFDGDLETKYADNADKNSYWAIWKYDTAYVANRFIWATANDSGEYPRRMGDGWTLSGSNDGTDWQVLYVGKTSDYENVSYSYFWMDLPDNEVPYQYYELRANNGGDSDAVQLSMVGIAILPPPPTKPFAPTDSVRLKNAKVDFIGPELGWGDNGDTGRQAAFDDDAYTFYDPNEATMYSSAIGLKLSEAYVLTEIQILPRWDFLNRFDGASIWGFDGDTFNPNTATKIWESNDRANIFEYQVITPEQFIPGTNTGFTNYVYYNAMQHGDVAEIELYGVKVDQPPENQPIFKVESISGKPGEVVEVTVNLENNQGLAAYALKLHYDQNLLTYIGFADGTISIPITTDDYGEISVDNGVIVISGFRTNNITNDGILFKINFRINENAEIRSYPNILTLSYSYGGIYGINNSGGNVFYNPVLLAGSVNVIKNILYGDVDGDGVITMADVVRLARHVAWIDRITDPDDLAAADVDGNGVVNTADVIRLARYMAMIDTNPLGPK